MASLQIHSLRLFCDIVRRRSFSQAAVENGLTQSAASQAVQTIEEYVGARLIDRSKRPFILTVEGQRFFDGVNSLVRQFDDLLGEVREAGEDLKGDVSVAAIYSIGLSYLPPLEALFTQRHPSARLSIQLAQPDEVYRLVDTGSVDFGLISFPESSKTVQCKHWRDEEMVLVASPRHKLSGLAEVKPEDLADCALVAFSPQLRIRQAIDKHLRAKGISMRTVVELDNLDSVNHAVLVNSGIAIIPSATVANEIANRTLVQINCHDITMTRPLGFIQRRDTAPSPTTRAFMDLISGSNNNPPSAPAVVASVSQTQAEI